MCSSVLASICSVNVADMDILVRAMHWPLHDELTLEASSSIIPEVQLSVLLTNPGYNLRKMISIAKSIS
jgi:hypothetical protein